MDYVLPNDYVVGNTMDKLNFGFVKFRWGQSKETSSVKLSVFDYDKFIRVQKEVKYVDLMHSDKYKDNIKCEERLNSKIKPFSYYYDYYSQRPRAIVGYILFFLFLYGLFSLILTMLLFCLGLLFWPCKKCCKKKKEKEE